MFINDWKKECVTIPNILSLFRLFVIPVYVIIYLNAVQDWDYFIAAAIIAVSCLTDMIDGLIARRCNMITNLGKLLDPLADKMTQLALTVCLSVRYPALRYVLVLFVVKEVFQTGITFITYKHGKVLSGSLPAGKICTTVLFTSLSLLVLLPDLDPKAVHIIAIVDILFLVYSLLSYTWAYCGGSALLQDFEP